MSESPIWCAQEGLLTDMCLMKFLNSTTEGWDVSSDCYSWRPQKNTEMHDGKQPRCSLSIFITSLSCLLIVSYGKQTADCSLIAKPLFLFCSQKNVNTIIQTVMWENEYSTRAVYNSYLPGRGDTMIKKVVHPGRGSAIALRLC